MSGGYDLNGIHYGNKRDAINAEMAQCNEIDNRIDGQRIAYLENKIRKLESELEEDMASPLDSFKARAIAELIGVDRKYKLSTDMIETYILEYGQHIAKQQRKNCANNMPSRWETDSIGHEDLEDIDALIFFAPEPKF